jgi:hypothetical protein
MRFGTHKEMIKEMRGDEEENKLLFLNQNVKLVKSDGFVLTGKILKMNKTNILFETNQATSLISLSNIKELIIKKRERNENDEKK